MRNCVFCKHFKLSYEEDWSDVTPGGGFEIGCANYDAPGRYRLYGFSQYSTTASEFRDIVTEAAANCDGYEYARANTEAE